MKPLFILLLLGSVLFLYSCKQSSNPVSPAPSVQNKIPFTLEAHKQSDTGSTTVTFIGKLGGSFDTLKVTDPGAFILGVDSAVAPYIASANINNAQSSYSVTQKVWAGSYKVVMLLKCANNLNILSDTLALTILPDDSDNLRYNITLYDKYVLAMNNDSIAALFTSDGQMISGGTITAQTPAGIKSYLSTFNGVVKVLEQKTTVTSVTVNGNSGVVTGTYTQKYKLLSNNQTGTASGSIRYEWVKTGGRWLISKAITN
jgi:hypothetical protein